MKPFKNNMNILDVIPNNISQTDVDELSLMPKPSTQLIAYINAEFPTAIVRQSDDDFPVIIGKLCFTMSRKDTQRYWFDYLESKITNHNLFWKIYRQIHNIAGHKYLHLEIKKMFNRYGRKKSGLKVLMSQDETSPIRNWEYYEPSLFNPWAATVEKTLITELPQKITMYRGMICTNNAEVWSGKPDRQGMALQLNGGLGFSHTLHYGHAMNFAIGNALDDQFYSYLLSAEGQRKLKPRHIVGKYSVDKSDLLTIFDHTSQRELLAMPNKVILIDYDEITQKDFDDASRGYCLLP